MFVKKRAVVNENLVAGTIRLIWGIAAWIVIVGGVPSRLVNTQRIYAIMAVSSVFPPVTC